MRIAFLNIVLLASLATFSTESLALSSVAAIRGEAARSWAVQYNAVNQKTADTAALADCRASARKGGLSGMASKCEIIARPEGPGFGAVSCGDKDCYFTFGYDDKQEAVDDAYAGCAKSHEDCNSEHITSWSDTRGFAQTRPAPAKNNQEDCRPRSNSLRCSSQCSNGNCIVSYENGCKIRVRVNPRFNPFNSAWEYPSPGC